MALVTRLSNAAAKAACDAIVDLIDGGATAMQMHIDAELERLQLEEDETVVQLLHEFMMQ